MPTVLFCEVYLCLGVREACVATTVLCYCVWVMSQYVYCMFLWCGGGRTGNVSDHVFVLQLCVRGLGLQARRLQQETLWFGRAGESHPRSTHLFAALFVFGRDCPLILLLPFMIPPPFLSLHLFCWHVWTTEGDWWVMTYWVWSNDGLCQRGSAHGRLAHGDAGLCYLLSLQS